MLAVDSMNGTEASLQRQSDFRTVDCSLLTVNVYESLTQLA